MTTERSETPRAPAVAGTFYPSDAEELHAELRRCFEDPRGPGRLPEPRRRSDRRIRAMVVPHAGYVYSGPIAAHAFAAIAEERPPATVLLLGVNHHGQGAPAALSEVPWRTPLGAVPSDPELVDALDRAPLRRDETAHALDHSIEVELPFLQYVIPHPRCVELSISFGTLAFLTDVAAVVRRAIAGRDVLLVASSDFSHYVPPEVCRVKDDQALEALLGGSAESLYTTVLHEGISMCGVAPTTVLLAALEEEPLLARKLRWGHSGEGEPMRKVVGYASVLFESEAALEPES